MAINALLMCGVISSVLYVGADILAAMSYEGYSYAAQTVSELFAVDSPTRPVIVPIFFSYSVLVIVFGLGVRACAQRNRSLQMVSTLIVVAGLLDLIAYFFPMNMRGVERSFTDTMHIVLASVTVLLILLKVWFGGRAFGPRFRLYSIVTLVVIFVFGLLAGLDGPRIAANLPTPWVGITERICIYGYMLWMGVLAVTLLRTRDSVNAD